MQTALESKLALDRADDLAARPRRIDRQRIRGWLEIGELARQQAGPGGMAAAIRESSSERLRVGVQVDEPHGAEITAQDLPIAGFERGACEDQVFAATERSRDH